MDKERVQLFLERHICCGTDSKMGLEEQFEIREFILKVAERDEIYEMFAKEGLTQD